MASIDAEVIKTLGLLTLLETPMLDALFALEALPLLEVARLFMMLDAEAVPRMPCLAVMVGLANVSLKLLEPDAVRRRRRM